MESRTVICLFVLVAVQLASGMVQPGTPSGIPAEFDCEMRKLAYTYGKSLRPDRGTFRTLFEALQLQFCNMSTPAEMDEYTPPNLPTPTTGLILFVAPNGNDSNAGTKEAPMATLSAAITSLRGACNGATVLLRTGSYHIDQTIELGSEHSGLTIQNYEGELVTLTGASSLTVPKSAWSPHKIQAGWEVSAGANNVFGAAKSAGDTATIKYLGSFNSPEECEAAATADSEHTGPFLSFTYHGANSATGSYKKQCFGRTDDVWAPTSEQLVYSGQVLKLNTWVASVSGYKEMAGLRRGGQRMIRAKYPNGDPEESGHFLEGAGASMGGGDYVKGWVPLSAHTEWVKPARKPDSQEIIATAADWPSVDWPMSEKGGSSWTGEGDWGDYHLGLGGYCDDLDPPFGYWCSMDPPRGQCWNKKKNTGRGCTQTHMSPDGMVLERAQNYSDPTTAVVQSWRGGGRWFTQQWRVESFNKSSSTLNFDPTTGMQGGEGGTTSGQWWIENVKEECDSANEWFYDEQEQKLYFNPNSTDTGPDGSEEWAVPSTRVLFNISGTQQQPVKDITITGVVLRDTRYTYLDVHGMPSGGDWALQRSAAVMIEGTEGISLTQSLLTRLDGNGVAINGYNRNATVSHNEFSWIGDSAMFAWGHTGTCLNENCTKKLPYKVGPDGRGGEQPRGTTIGHNLVREIGIWQKQSSMWFQAITAQTQLINNVHFNGPRAGVNFNDGFGGGDLMKGNLIANCVRESGDHGPFNSWDRVPYITDIATGKPSIVPQFRELTRNFIIATYSSQEAIDTDDGSAYYNTHHNFFVYAADGLKSDFGGHDNYHNDNVYAYTNNCWGNGNMNEFINNTCIANSGSGGFASDCSKAPYMVISGNKIYNSEGKLSSKICDASNKVEGAWPDANTVVAMAKKVLEFE